MADEDYYSRLQLVHAQELAGDKAGAAATREQLMTANRRGSAYLFARSEVNKLAPPSATR